MTRSEAIAIINAELAVCDDARLLEIAEMLSVSVPKPTVLLRDLTARELALIEQSKEDFKAGRTLTIEEARARTNVYLAQRLALRAKA